MDSRQELIDIIKSNEYKSFIAAVEAAVPVGQSNRSKALAQFLNQAIDESGNTALHLAVLSGSNEIIEFLLGTNGVRVDVKNSNQKTPLETINQALNELETSSDPDADSTSSTLKSAKKLIIKKQGEMSTEKLRPKSAEVSVKDRSFLARRAMAKRLDIGGEQSTHFTIAMQLFAAVEENPKKFNAELLKEFCTSLSNALNIMHDPDTVSKVHSIFDRMSTIILAQADKVGPDQAVKLLTAFREGINELAPHLAAAQLTRIDDNIEIQSKILAGDIENFHRQVDQWRTNIASDPNPNKNAILDKINLYMIKHERFIQGNSDARNTLTKLMSEVSKLPAPKSASAPAALGGGDHNRDQQAELASRARLRASHSRIESPVRSASLPSTPQAGKKLASPVDVSRSRLSADLPKAGAPGASGSDDASAKQEADSSTSNRPKV